MVSKDAESYVCALFSQIKLCVYCQWDFVHSLAGYHQRKCLSTYGKRSLSKTGCILKQKCPDKWPVTEANVYKILAYFVCSPRKYTRRDAWTVGMQKIYSAEISAKLIFELMILLIRTVPTSNSPRQKSSLDILLWLSFKVARPPTFYNQNCLATTSISILPACYPTTLRSGTAKMCMLWQQE